MSEKSENLRSLKVESVLPVKTVGIECLKESNPEKMSPHRYLFKWFARRPTAATRLAVLASVLPEKISNDTLLELMQIGPDRPEQVDGSISDYVIKRWATKDSRDGRVSDHFGYPIPHSQSPTIDEMDALHSELRDCWDGELPTVLDPTAGGGTIPLESLRYGLPTVANELNPVAWLLNKVILDHAKNVGSIEKEISEWSNQMQENASGALTDYYPAATEGQTPNHYLCTYSVKCSSCGYRIPLANRWWFKKKSANEGHAIRPHTHEDRVEYEHVEFPSDVDKSEFNPDKGVVESGDAECLNCGVITERETIKQRLTDREFEYEVCGVQYVESRTGKSGYRGGNQADKEAVERAQEKIESDLDLRTLLAIDRDAGDQSSLRVSDSIAYGMEEWRDIYSPRQLLSHATYLDAFEQVKGQVMGKYPASKAETILTILALSAVKLIERNSKLEPIDIRRGSPANMLGSNNFGFQWAFGESNITVGSYSFESSLNVVLGNYEQLTKHLENVKETPVTVLNGDAANMDLEEGSVDAVVMDPPYGDNVKYADLSDSLYVWIREYLGDIYSDEFRPPLTDKTNEAIENPSRVQNNNNSNLSKDELARQKYEIKMSDIFSEVYDAMAPAGVLTIYFTEKETSAWDSLTMSLINSGFAVTATHTITSEMPQRIGVQQVASADSTLLLTCRKPHQSQELEERSPTLWSDIKQDTRRVAQEKANELLDSGLNLTKTDTIISAFGPTLRVFTESYPVVDKYDERVRPREALEEARTAVTKVLVERELSDDLEGVDSLSAWYILSWLVYGRNSIPYDEANQLGLGVGVHIDNIKRDTKIWGKSKDTLLLKGQDYRVQDYTALESGNKRRKRAYPIDPREQAFSHTIDTVHAALNVLETKGSDFAWNWLKERSLQNDSSFKTTIEALLQVLPENNEDYKSLINLASGQTGELLDIDIRSIEETEVSQESRTTLQDFE